MKLIGPACAVLAASLAAGCGAVTTTRGAATTTTAALPDVARIACDEDGARVLTDRVRPQRDGIHLGFANQAGKPLDYSIETDASGQGGSLPEAGAQTVAALPPGPIAVSCTDPASTADPGDAKRVTLQVEDPDGLWTPAVVDPTCGEHVGIDADYGAGDHGERLPAVEAARRYLADNKALKPGDVVARAGYPEQAEEVVALTRDNRVIAVVDFRPDGYGGRFLDSVDACQGIGLG